MMFLGFLLDWYVPVFVIKLDNVCIPFQPLLVFHKNIYDDEQYFFLVGIGLPSHTMEMVMWGR